MGTNKASTQLLTRASILVISVVLLGATVSAAVVMSDRHVAVSLTGIVTDSVCGRDHGVKTPADAECTRTCIELGAQYALAVNRSVYLLQGHELDLERFAGSDVRVKGRMSGPDKVIVEQVERVYTEATGRR